MNFIRRRLRLCNGRFLHQIAVAIDDRDREVVPHGQTPRHIPELRLGAVVEVHERTPHGMNERQLGNALRAFPFWDVSHRELRPALDVSVELALFPQEVKSASLFQLKSPISEKPRSGSVIE